MTRCYVRDLVDGDAVDRVLLVRDKQVRANRNGNLYLQFNLDDRTGTIAARYWNSSESETRAFEPGDFLSVRGKVQTFQGQLQLIVNAFRRCDPDTVDAADFIPTTEKNVDAMMNRVRGYLERIGDPTMQAIARSFLMDDEFMQKFMRAPAGIRNHHAYVGGLLEHVTTLLDIHERISDLYPDLDHDLLRLGILLHDVGKVRELAFDRVFSYTDVGEMIGHLVLGVEMLDEKLPVAEDLLGEPLSQEVVCRIKHLILSHHGTYEFGSPRLPMTPEAIALHHLDNLDAKVHGYVHMIREDANPGSAWTAYDPSMRRRLYKGPLAHTGSSSLHENPDSAK
ncbi:3'-5' exoribonuclease YhaM [Planctomycetes bacterium Pan216]|uniref:3'-5' exoribonuclease YhaM n=1 Tax=Kolteria novifilia TaxID=2527975 RepID=A0A518BAN8_9BACT|nr:3'-5' exoribonuclease YhaM [Planctomycetes bacterium Pan216]